MIHWVIYDHPKDMPDWYVARRWVVNKDGPKYTADVILEKDLDRLRDRIKERMPEGHCLTRFKDDDPNIVEVWL